ncbi:MAG TPA: polyprenol phosphomannose-dependent alpha 1,6 mannosyltransferase MptB [Solirubrobacteraceae bacterium]|nr:polyprenol phosphomannose-dependent alpha 1,6 mannosyltransferase MptB [Solirubrobacteraceae bacterium]
MRSTWLWAALGLVGSLLIAYASPRAVPDPAVHWWYVPAVPAGRGVSLGLVYAGMAALSAGWLGLGRSLPSRRGLLLIAAAWALPLALAPPLFSRDVYSYLAQGTILHLGHSPYHSAPEVLAGLGRPRVLDAVSPFWRGTTAPYGPLFLGLVSLIVGGVGSRLVAGVLLIRLVELIGVVLLASAVPRLTRALGTDTRRGLWLALLSPLMMLQLISAGHNDVLMVGLMAAGVAIALAGRPLTGIALCALAATVKVPALAGVLFIAAAWARAETSRAQRTRFLLAAGAITIAVLGAVTALTGAGVDWLSTSLFSTPAKVRLALTPATAVGYTIASLLRDAGVTTTGRGLEGALGLVATGLTALAGLVMLWRVRVVTMVASLGAFLLLAAVAGPALWPWYLEWGLALIAAVRWAQRSALLPAAIVVAAFVVKPNGILGLPRPTAPAVLAVYAAAGLAIWIGHRRRAIGGDRQPPASGAGSGDTAPAAMTSTASSALTGG